MTTGYGDMIYGNCPLMITSLTRRKVPGTIKQKVGMTIVKHQIPSRTTQDWEISMNGMIYDTSTTAVLSRTYLEALDDKEKHHYADGLITGSYIIDDLTFDDSEDSPLSYKFKLTLVEYNQ